MVGEDIDFQVVTAVEDSWWEIKKIPDYSIVAGEILFRKIFELAPPALNMFSFGPQFVGNEESLYSSPVFKAHAKKVVSMLDEAVKMLGPDLEPVLLTLGKLGAMHVNYGVLPAHYGIVGEALLHTLSTALGTKWTPKVKEGWTLVYSLVSTAMIQGAEKQLERKQKLLEKRRARLEKRISSLNVSRHERRQASDRTARQSMAGIAGGVSKTSNTSLSEQVASLVDGALNLGREDDDSSFRSDSTAPLTEDPAPEDIQYSHMIESVYSSWDKVKKIPNYEEVAGVLLFRKIFEIAPVARELFAFTKGYGEEDDALFSDPAFLKHATRVVKMLDAAVNMLGPDLEPVSKTLEALGARHVAYGVVPEHYPIVGQALLATLEAALGDSWTPTVEEGWKGIYSFVSTTMIKGAERKSSKKKGSKATSASSSEGVQYSEMIESVSSTWDKVTQIPNYEEVAGVLLFRNIFEIAPVARGLFAFTKGYGEEDDALFSDPAFLKHATRVVKMLDAAVNMLGPDLEPVSKTLEALGARHVSYGVVPEHYPIVGQALLTTLEAALGDSWTPTVEEGWKGIYSFVSTTMIKGSKSRDA